MSNFNKQYRIFWLVGENSGDLHASLIMRKLNSEVQNLVHIGIGGNRMQQEGLSILFPFDRFAVMGFSEVLKHISFFIKVERVIKRVLTDEKPDLVILVDYPGLNLRVARFADDLRIPVLYYICPQFWAWKHNRVYKLRQYTRHVACILPFEKELLEIHNVTNTYVGHPIAEEVSFTLDRKSFAKFFGLDETKQWIGFLPGSRNMEVSRILPEYLKTIQLLPHDNYQFLISKARTVSKAIYQDIFEEAKPSDTYTIDGYNYEMMKYCDALAVTSGTATLEAAYIGTPIVIIYKTSRISYMLGKHFIHIDRIGLPNIVLNQDLLPELIQEEATPESIKDNLMKFLNDKSLVQHIRFELNKLKGLLSDKHNSSEMVKLIKGMLKIT